MHFDGVHLRIPPRLVVLFCVQNTEERPTLVVSWQNVVNGFSDVRALEREVFWLRNGRYSFMDSILDRDRQFVRLDPGCMIPATRGAGDVMRDTLRFAQQAKPDQICLHPGEVLILDNWRVMHGRGLPRCEGERTLLRLQLDL
jgi:alpha-ketoglutarate-dependent taurine dioxygenase